MNSDILDPLTPEEKGLLSELRAIRAERDQLREFLRYWVTVFAADPYDCEVTHMKFVERAELLIKGTK